jgi:bacteriorhodopsin
MSLNTKYHDQSSVIPNTSEAVRFSFMITYTIMLTTATITIIEALRTQIPEVRHVLNLETAISLIAGYYYGIFISKVEDKTNPIDWLEITKIRYVDWCITTPLMLITLCLVLGINSKKPIHLTTMISIVALNYLMLFIGYYGVIHPSIKLMAMIGGFIPFIAMFYLVYKNFYGSGIIVNKVLFALYLVVWGMYGVVYMFPEIYKNVCMNILDLIAKCLIGLGLWVYYSKIINRI